LVRQGDLNVQRRSAGARLLAAPALVVTSRRAYIVPVSRYSFQVARPRPGAA